MEYQPTLSRTVKNPKTREEICFDRLGKVPTTPE